MKIHLYSFLFYFTLFLCAPWALAHELSDSEKASIALPKTYEGLPGEGPIRGQHDWFHNVWNQRRSSWVHSTKAVSYTHLTLPTKA